MLAGWANGQPISYSMARLALRFLLSHVPWSSRSLFLDFFGSSPAFAQARVKLEGGTPQPPRTGTWSDSVMTGFPIAGGE